MELNEYQCKAGAMAVYPDRGNNQLYPLLGLVDEVGEVVEKWSGAVICDPGTGALLDMVINASIIAGIFKKTIRDGSGIVTDASRDVIARLAHDIRRANELLVNSLCDEKNLEIGASNADETDELKKELGDALWYVQQCCTEFGFSFDSAASDNLLKLQSRQERGVLKGSGDNR